MTVLQLARGIVNFIKLAICAGQLESGVYCTYSYTSSQHYWVSVGLA